MNDYARYFFGTNHRNPLGNNGRRICVFDSDPVYRGDFKYFTELIAHIGDPINKWAFYSYLKTTDTYKTPIEFQINTPITKAYKEVRALNAPLHLKWIVDEVYKGNLTDAPIAELYKSFVKWAKKTRERTAETLITQTAFGILLNNSKQARKEVECLGEGYSLIENDIGEKVKGRLCNTMVWNIEGVVNGLKKPNMLDNEFIYEPKLNNEFEGETDDEF